MACLCGFFVSVFFVVLVNYDILIPNYDTKTSLSE